MTETQLSGKPTLLPVSEPLTDEQADFNFKAQSRWKLEAYSPTFQMLTWVALILVIYAIMLRLALYLVPFLNPQ
ncbi:hypothetical protein EON80_07630 [bacterium]|nr:MAG: hypothetical protein EON80_07630 [bacterium]